MSIYGFKPTDDDVKWALTFAALYTFLGTHPKSEEATLLLSTCRNAYLTINAEFADIQELLGGAVASPLRAGLEMIDQGSLDGPKIKECFQKALGTIAHFDFKKRVWKDCKKIHESILQSLATYEAKDELNARLISSIVHGTGPGPSNLDNGWHDHLLRLNLAKPPNLQTYFKTLNKLRDLLDAIARFGISYVDTIIAPLPTTADLFANDDGKVETGAASEEVPVDRTVAFWAEKIASSCDWATDNHGPLLRIKVKFWYLRPDAAVKTDYTFKRNSEGNAIARTDAAAFIREALWCAHGIAIKKFEPNISSPPPMPAVFNISLPLPRPVLTNADIQPPQLFRKPCGTHRTPNLGKLALAHLTVPVSKLNLMDYAFEDNDIRRVIEADVTKAVDAAKENACQALVFPEYSIPLTLRDSLQELATSKGITIIGGFEGSWEDNKLVDEAFVAIPGEPKLNHQFKQSPSLEEQLPSSMFHDELFYLFTHSPIGNFAVVVCSDFLEKATLDAWSLQGALPDILFVVARNPYPDLYKHFAITDSFRLYCSIAVCNVFDGKEDGKEKTTSEGTFVVSPRRNDPIDMGADVGVEGTYLNKITVHEIPLYAIRGRERGKPESGFFAAPRSARRLSNPAEKPA
jgi:hypothetical protein